MAGAWLRGVIEGTGKEWGKREKGMDRGREGARVGEEGQGDG